MIEHELQTTNFALQLYVSWYTVYTTTYKLQTR